MGLMMNNFKDFFGFNETAEEEALGLFNQPKKVEPVVKQQPKENRSNILPLQGRRNKPADNKNMSGIFVCEPKKFDEDSRLICNYLKENHVVVVNLKYLDTPTGKRLMDFVCGTIYAFEGRVTKLGGNIFLCAPNAVDIYENQTSDVVFNQTTEAPAEQYYYQEARTA